MFYFRSDALKALGLDESASPEEINARAMKLLIKVHPDKAGDQAFTALCALVIAARDIALGKRQLDRLPAGGRRPEPEPQPAPRSRPTPRPQPTPQPRTRSRSTHQDPHPHARTHPPPPRPPPPPPPPGYDDDDDIEVTTEELEAEVMDRTEAKLNPAKAAEVERRIKNGWLIGGATFNVKEQLKALGGWWNEHLHMWMMRDQATYEQALKIMRGAR